MATYNLIGERVKAKHSKKLKKKIKELHKDYACVMIFPDGKVLGVQPYTVKP